MVGAHREQEFADSLTFFVAVEVSVDALEEPIDGALRPAGGQVGDDAEDEDADVELLGLGAAIPDGDEAQRVGRGRGPAVVEKHTAEVRRVEEDARLPLQPATYRCTDRRI